ncbi:hypothetical protein DIURU_003637 [Diutina rugosa]|uniref:Aminopeptidase n=1 Tax=Diutina rugosa TaxID=5481 RepID=A0A642ULN1_DIURU|nr:uncharacterized protein DIURU_003637 [Diutina rugosa]KAA8901267.1 hypothetical protein DIURU_003637 [Diutina rugosa]
MPYYECLPFTVRPSHYVVDVTAIDFGNDTYHGVTTIDVAIDEATDELHLNYRDLTIDSVELTPEGQTAVVASNIEYNQPKEYFVAHFPMKFEPGKAQVSIKYQGRIQTNMAGFYKSSYQDQGETKYMYSTQFEATDARRAFPCFDEPARKATFDVSIKVPKHHTALGNMPVVSEVEEGDDKVVKFATSPVMSTYLVAWAFGEFDFIESHTKDLYVDNKPLPCRIYTTKGSIEDAVFASSITPKIVDFFSKIFDIKYPLPKLDLLAVHSFSHNAMENWGLVTYRATALLYNEQKSSAAYKKKVAYVVAHELAHQWFGNLVTMAWWDELYENEAFATLIGYVAVDHLFPEWDIFSGFVSESVQSALTLDGLRNSHPIEVPVNDALDIDQVFDAISYLKGSSVLLMLQTFLGKEKFLSGVSKYLKAHQYANATTKDLFGAIGEVSGKPVEEMMKPWIKQIGFPVVSVTKSGDKLKLTQSRFLNSGDVTAEENKTRWWIPLNANTPVEIDAFVEESAEITAPEGLFKLNTNCSGFYRVQYAQDIFEKHILPYFSDLSPADKVGLIADAAFMAIAGKSTTAEFIAFLRGVAPKLGDDYVVWLELSRVLSKFVVAFGGQTPATDAKLKQLQEEIYQDKGKSVVTELGQSTSPSTDYLKVSLQSNVLTGAGGAGVKEVVDYAHQLFKQWQSSGKMDPSLRGFVWQTVASQPELSQADFNAIFAQVTSPTSLDSREIALGALGHITNLEYLPKLLDSLIDDSVIPIMDAHFLGQPLSANPITRDDFWIFFRDHYDDFYKLMSTNMVVLDRFVRLTLCNYQSESKRNEIEGFFAAKDVHGFERAFKQALDYISIQSAWYQRSHGDI